MTPEEMEQLTDEVCDVIVTHCVGPHEGVAKALEILPELNERVQTELKARLELEG